MSQKAKKKRRLMLACGREQYLYPFDYQAEQENRAIIHKASITPTTARLRKYYYVDGYKFNTGQNRRQGGGLRYSGDSNKRPIAKPVQRRNGKQINLRSKRVHEWIEQSMKG